MTFFISFYRRIKYKLLISASFILFLNSFFFIERKSSNRFPLIFDEIKIHYLIYIICFAFIILDFKKRFSKNRFSLKQMAQMFLLILLPMEISLILGLFIFSKETNAHSAFYIFTSVYLIACMILFLKSNTQLKKSNSFSRKTIFSWIKKQGLIFISILLFSISIFSYFTLNNISKYAAVDEPLWTMDRIPHFWKNVLEKDWKNTSVSDKPGITVAIISGIGLLNEPVKYEQKIRSFEPNKDIYTINNSFRLPLAIFCVFSIIFFYILIQKLLGKEVALISTIFISTSPILIGISRIINPDTILWIFTSFSILAYLIFLKEKTYSWLYLTGIFLGLSILTKYVANILYIFFFLIIFLEYIFRDKPYNITQYLKESFINFTSLVFVSLITFCLLFPETWVNFKKIFTGTILSQAFITIAPIFISIILFLILDIYFLKNKISIPIFNFLSRKKYYLILFFSSIILFFIIFTFINTWSSMRFINFEEILDSPKSSYKTNSFLSIFSTNFFPLLFTPSPIILIGFLFSSVILFKKNNILDTSLKTTIYFIIFILLYYFGTTFNNVASTIRYQIILYPLFFIISSIGILEIIKTTKDNHQKYLLPLMSIVFMIISLITLIKNKPFYFGYASSLLPEKYIVDTKDMGDGSYEAAQYLNSLPNAKNLFIWTDKTGVCEFFIGKCDSFYDLQSFKENKIDYFVVSAGRKNKFITATNRKTDIPYSFEKIYDSSDPDLYISIGNRPNNYVKIVRSDLFRK